MNKDKFSPRFTELMQRAETRCIGFSHSASEWSEIMDVILALLARVEALEKVVKEIK